MGLVYFLEFTFPLGSDRHQARYYIGYTSRRLCHRLGEHLRAEGAAITRAAVLRTGPHIQPFRVVWCIRGDRWTERMLKRQRNHSRFASMSRRDVRAFIRRAEARHLVNLEGIS